MTFGPKRDDVTGNWRKLHDEDLHDLYSSPYVIGVIESRIRWGEGGGVWEKHEMQSLVETAEGQKPR